MLTTYENTFLLHLNVRSSEFKPAHMQQYFHIS